MKKQEVNFFTLGLCSIVVGALGPPSILAYSLYGLGILTTLAHFMSKEDKFKMLFDKCGLRSGELYPELIEKKQTQYGYCLRYSLPPGLSSIDFIKNEAAISELLGKKIEIKYKHKSILIEVYEKELEREYPYEIINTKGIVEIVIGYSYKGIETVDLCPSKGNVHLLLAGQTGGGKSTLLRQIITTLLLTKDPKLLDLSLLDLKGTEFQIFKNTNMIKRYASNIEQATRVIEEIKLEVDRRNELFARTGVVDILEYNKNNKNPLKHELVIVDEFHLLRQERKGVQTFEELAAISRSAGIHLLLCTQSPRAEIITGLLKSNIPTILGLRVMNSLNSRIIIDQEGLETLRGKGNGILQRAGENIEIQAMNIQPQESRNLIKKVCNKVVANFKTKEKIGEVNLDFIRKWSN